MHQAYNFRAGHISVGAASDSLHEYLLKLYLLTGQTDKVSLDLCERLSFRDKETTFSKVRVHRHPDYQSRSDHAALCVSKPWTTLRH